MLFGNASTSNLTFRCMKPTQTKWVPEALAIIHHFGLSKQNFKKPICTTGYSSLNAWQSSHKLCSINRFCIYYFFPH